MARIGGVAVGGKNPVRVMGILNASPESFHKGSVKRGRAAMGKAAARMQEQGADFIDVGGMSTAPYLRTAVSEKAETARVLGAVGAIRDASDLPISVDTCRAGVARAALEQGGVQIINDISGLKYDPAMPGVISRFAPSLILCAYGGIRAGASATSSSAVRTRAGLAGGGNDAAAVARRLLGESLQIAGDSDIQSSRIVLDPAVGFFRRGGLEGSFITPIRSDRVRRDLEVITNLDSVRYGGIPMLVSVSNKSFLGDILGRPDPAGRLYGSLAAEAACVMNGADMVRTHNVGQTRDAVAVASRIAGRRVA